MVLEESLYAADQATSDTSLEYNEFELSCDVYLEICNELIRLRRVSHCFDVLPNIFNNFYTFKRRGVLSTLDVFKPKNDKRHTRLMSRNFNPKDLRRNPSQEEELDAYQALSQLLATLLSTLKSKPAFVA